MQSPRKEAEDPRLRSVEDSSEDMGPEPGQGPRGLFKVHTERHRLQGLQLPHPNTDWGQAHRPSQDLGQSPEQELKDSCRSLQEHPEQVPRNRDLGPPTGLIP